MALIEMSGKRFNRWTVLCFDRFDERGEAYWLCRCDCGTVRPVAGYTLRKGTSKGCDKCRPVPGNLGTTYVISDGTAVFRSRRGDVFLVSPEDAKKVSKYTWCLNTRGYVAARIDGTVLALHRFLLNIAEDRLVDHINGDRLDNRRDNLRLVDSSQNAQNMNISTRNTSGYKGVHWNKRKRRWQANIRAYNKQRFLGWFSSREEAALADNDAAKKAHGEFACLNPIGDTEGFRVVVHNG